ncbi:MAG: polyhydroxyalkanoate synthesis regulator [Syntrophomonas sp.]|nr:polyhydroxyalkanoate synthesis regulator [Syntrophomonas sp.]
MSFMLKAVNLGLGAISLTKEKAEKFIDEMVEKGEINREDAKQTLDEVIKKGAEYREEIRTLAREEIDNWRSKCAVVSRADYEKLEQRIKELENKLSKL